MKPRRRKLTNGQKLAMAGGLLIFLGFAGWLYGGDYLRQRDLAFGRAAEAKVEGPPCPQLTEAEFTARKLKAPKATNYENVVFGPPVRPQWTVAPCDTGQGGGPRPIRSASSPAPAP